MSQMPTGEQMMLASLGWGLGTTSPRPQWCRATCCSTSPWDSLATRGCSSPLVSRLDARWLGSSFHISHVSVQKQGLGGGEARGHLQALSQSSGLTGTPQREGTFWTRRSRPLAR